MSVDRQRFAVAFTGVGAALVFAGQKPTYALVAAVYVLALAGVRTLTDGRTPKIVLFAPIVAWTLSLAWTFFHNDAPSYPHLYAPEGWVSSIADFIMLAALFATVMAAEPKIGSGIAWFIGSAMLLRVGADSILRLAGTLRGGDLAPILTRVLTPLSLVGGMGRRLTPVAWIALALCPFQISRMKSNALGVIGAMGLAICYALSSDLTDLGGRHFIVVNVLLFVLGWIMTMLGTIGVALSNRKALAWVGFVLVLIQLIACPVLVILLDANDARVPVAMSILFGALGLALVALSGDLPLRPFRLVAGGLFSLGALGSAIMNVGVVASVMHIVRLNGEPGDWWCAQLARLGMDSGLLVLCVTLILLSMAPRP